MSKDDLMSKKRSYSFHHRPNENKNPKPWNASKVKNKLFSKNNNPVNKSFKKLGPNKLRKNNWVSKKIKKAMHKEGQPPTPHNTTQFIVDAIHYPTDPYIYEFDNNWFEHNFQNHAMAGSMMDLMQERIRRDSEEAVQPQEGTPMTVTEEKEDVKRLDEFGIIPPLRMVKSADDSENITSASDTETKSYDQFLKEAENGKNLHDVIKQLVHVIRRKDSQINSLLTNGEKKEFTQES